MLDNSLQGFTERLIEFLCSIMSLRESDNRTSLLIGLPTHPVSTLPRRSSPEGDLRVIVEAASSWGMIEQDTLALAVVMRNATRFVEGTAQGASLHDLQNELSHLVQEPVVFVNRRKEIEDIYRQSSFLFQTWAIDGPAGYGKTTLILELKGHYEREKSKTWACAYVKIPRGITWGMVKLGNELARSCGLPVFKGRPHPDPSIIGQEVAGLILRSEKMRGAIIKGIAVFFDNVDVLDQDGLKALTQLIEGMRQGLQASGYWKSETNLFRVFLAGRHICTQLQDLATPYTLSPFSFDAIKESVAEHALRTGSFVDNNEISAQLLFLTGGHPGAMADLLKQMAQKSFATAYDILDEERESGHLVEALVQDVESDFLRRGGTREVFGILKLLSVFRRYREWVLDSLIGREGFLEWNGTALDLERALQETRLITKKQGYLVDEITRRLLVIHLRGRNCAQSQGLFCRLCREAIVLYESRLRTTWKPELIAIEWLYQKLQCNLFCGTESESTPLAEDIEVAVDHVLETLSSMEEGPARISEDLIGELNSDWEFQFLYNLLVCKREACTYTTVPYEALVKRMQSFRGRAR